MFLPPLTIPQRPHSVPPARPMLSSEEKHQMIAAGQHAGWLKHGVDSPNHAYAQYGSRPLFATANFADCELPPSLQSPGELHCHGEATLAWAMQ